MLAAASLEENKVEQKAPQGSAVEETTPDPDPEPEPEPSPEPSPEMVDSDEGGSDDGDSKDIDCSF